MKESLKKRKARSGARCFLVCKHFRKNHPPISHTLQKKKKKNFYSFNSLSFPYSIFICFTFDHNDFTSFIYHSYKYICTEFIYICIWNFFYFVLLYGHMVALIYSHLQSHQKPSRINERVYTKKKYFFITLIKLFNYFLFCNTYLFICEYLILISWRVPDTLPLKFLRTGWCTFICLQGVRGHFRLSHVPSYIYWRNCPLDAVFFFFLMWTDSWSSGCLLLGHYLHIHERKKKIKSLMDYINYSQTIMNI